MLICSKGLSNLEKFLHHSISYMTVKSKLPTVLLKKVRSLLELQLHVFQWIQNKITINEKNPAD